MVTEAKEKAKMRTREELLKSTNTDNNSEDNLYLNKRFYINPNSQD